MSDLGDWEFPEPLRPKSDGWSFDVARALDSILSLSAEIPADAFTASMIASWPTAIRPLVLSQSPRSCAAFSHGSWKP